MEFVLKNGQVLTLRPLQSEDAERAQDFLDIIASETTFTNQYPGQPRQSTEEICAKYHDENSFFIGAFDASSNLCGSCSISIDKPGHPWEGQNASFGISSLKAMHGQGLGTRFLIEIERWARQKGVHRIYGRVRATNRKAISLYLKSGFQIEGLARETALIDGVWHDHYYIGKILA